MSIQKMSWNRDGSQINIGFDLQKINESERVIVGYATVDNVDFAGDIVTTEASVQAFSRFRGNIRFQHDKNRPVGRLLGFEVSKVRDSETLQEYNAIQVAVRISEAAEDVWKMCLDGTLSGFSIGGATTKAHHVFREDLNKTVKVIEEYTLTELSIVDSPANGLANIVNVFKSLDSIVDTEKSMNTLNLFWCSDDRLAIKEKTVHQNCPVCSQNMANIGRVNQNDDISKVLSSILNIEEQKGDTSMSDSTIVEKDNGEIEVDETVVEPASNEQESQEDVPVEHVEDAAAEEEPESEDEVDNSIQQIREDVEKSNASIKDELVKMGQFFNDKFNELEARYQKIEESTQNLAKKFDSYASDLGKTRDQISEIVNSTAIRKSLDEASEPETKKETRGSTFAGLFSGQQYTA